jgi:hypothetical protein
MTTMKNQEVKCQPRRLDQAACWGAGLLTALALAACGGGSVGKDALSGVCAPDSRTGLTWNSEAAETVNFAGLGALQAKANADSLCGHTNWRVPTANELLGLTSPVGAATPVTGTDTLPLSGRYWSGETVVGATDNAWAVDASAGGVTAFVAKTLPNKVKLVRSEALPPACGDVSRYQTRGDGTVTDTQTALVWKQCSEGLSGSACNQGSLQTFTSLQNLTSRVTDANVAKEFGYTDWRLPSRNEMASLVNRACVTPALEAGFFPATAAASYASNTPDANAADRFWYVDFFQGDVGVGALTVGRPLRLVRAGR